MQATRQNLKHLDRLKKRSDFVLTASKGQKWVSKTVIVQALALDGDQRDILKFGFTATKKIGNAVFRNRVKRRMRAAAADIAATHYFTGYYIVFIGRSETARCSADDLRKDMKWCLKRLDVLGSSAS